MKLFCFHHLNAAERLCLHSEAVAVLFPEWLQPLIEEEKPLLYSVTETSFWLVLFLLLSPQIERWQMLVLYDEQDTTSLSAAKLLPSLAHGAKLLTIIAPKVQLLSIDRNVGLRTGQTD